MPVVFDLIQGEALIGRHRVPIEVAGPHGEIRAEGTVLRPLAFGQRTQIVAQAAPTPQPVASVIAGVVRAVVETPPDAGLSTSPAIEALALALAGADRDGPAFSEAAYEIGRAGGWRLTDILDAPAVEVDRLASSRQQAVDDGWHRIEFGASSSDDDADLASIVTEYAANLLRRLDGLDAPVQLEQASSRAPRTPTGDADRAPRSVPSMDGRGAAGAPRPSAASDADGHRIAPRDVGEVGEVDESAVLLRQSRTLVDEAGIPTRPRVRLGRGAVFSTERVALDAPDPANAFAGRLSSPQTAHAPARAGGEARETTATQRPAPGELVPVRADQIVGDVTAASVAPQVWPADAGSHYVASHPHSLDESALASRLAPAAVIAASAVLRRPTDRGDRSTAPRRALLPPVVGGEPEAVDAVADQIAWLLDAECDLRGLER